ncbi:hypothetical protein CI610_03572 [invertebrate metagenome]|uniref:Uncharacterized protein n=1 Tax=invertebrate metagenome TaxID=1711999 RepID=A0A2H9T2Q3_9ZZZZ
MEHVLEKDLFIKKKMTFLAHHHQMVGYSNRPASVVRRPSVRPPSVPPSVNNSCYRYF